ncbi:hypothetical protein GCM10009592_28490 [Brachybacterium rhamnosum]|uniref:Uncharacterized protein n=1 Tax=Brachybacterium rhamnosum TaxID=173361 RepID=A0ABW4Q1N6_9MICO
MNTTPNPYTSPILPTDPRPIASLATIQPRPVREMTALLTRMYGPGLIVTNRGKRTVWALPAPPRKRTQKVEATAAATSSFGGAA